MDGYPRSRAHSPDHDDDWGARTMLSTGLDILAPWRSAEGLATNHRYAACQKCFTGPTL